MGFMRLGRWRRRHGGAQQFQDLLLEELFQRLGRTDFGGFARNDVHQLHGGLHADIRGDKQLFEILEHLIVDAGFALEQIFDIGSQNLAGFGKPAFEPRK